MIELIHLSKSFETVTPLTDVNAVINDGEVISIIGPSGTGKSTLLRCINMIDPPTGGKILLNGEEITAPGYDVNKSRRRIGMVFQSVNLFGHLTVIENVMLAPLEVLGVSKQEAYDKAIDLLDSVGLADRAFWYPDKLSGGQKQRAAIARTLAMDPDVILFDEPTTALDPANVGEVETVIRELAKSNKTLLIVTHDLKFARSISSRVFYMDQGIIYDDDLPEVIFDDPQKERTRRFIRQHNVLELKIESQNYNFLGKGAMIDQYCIKHHLSQKLANRLRSIINELVKEILLSRLVDPKIDVVIEYDEKKHKTNISVKYNGPVFDPVDTSNDQALKILMNEVTNMSHSSICEGEYTNLVTMEPVI